MGSWVENWVSSKNGKHLLIKFLYILLNILGVALTTHY
jgi:hypothetical protein